MKILASVLMASALAVAGLPLQAATVHYHHVHQAYGAHAHHHYHYYAGGVNYYYSPPPGYYPAPQPYYAPGVYVPGYFYATPEDPLGSRGNLKALIDSEWDPPFSGR